MSPVRAARAAAFLLTLLACATVSASQQTTPATGRVPTGPIPRVELWTMGPGDQVFNYFGHGTLCAYTEYDPAGRCYNYGTGDFDNPEQLVFDFLRGRSRFIVDDTSAAATLRFYRKIDRTIWVQPLPLTREQTLELIDLLEHDVLPENREYIYHHFYDNCTTRLRDHIDRVTGGKLRAGADIPWGPTWRDVTRAGFSRDLHLMILVEILLGRRFEGRPTLWDAMFHPDVLRAEVEARLGVEAFVINHRVKPVPSAPVARGRQAIALIGLALGAAGGLLVATGRRWPRRAGLVVVGLGLGLPALAMDALALLTILPELTRNEALLLLWPTDLALVGLSGVWLRRYLEVRLAALGLAVLACAAGLLIQPLAPLLFMLALPFAAVRVGLAPPRLR